MASSNTPPESPKMTEDTQQPLTASEKWHVGDITLISSDRVSFRVPSRALLVAR